MNKQFYRYLLKNGLVVFLFCSIPFVQKISAQNTAPCTKYMVDNTNNFCGCASQQFVPYGLFLETANGCEVDYYKTDSVVFEVRANGTAALRGIFRTFDGAWRPIYVNINFNTTTNRTPRFELCQVGRPTSIAADWQYFGDMSGTIQFDAAAPLSMSSRNGTFQIGIGAHGQTREEMGGSGYFTLSNGQKGGFGFKLNNPTAGNCILTHPCDNDTIRPVIVNCPANINLSTTGTNAVATWTAPTATDNCTPTVVLTNNFASGTAFPVGTTTVVFTARDTSRNTSTCSFNVVITKIDTCANDTTKPVFRNCPTNISLTTTGMTAVATWTAPTATDNCGTPSVTSNFSSGGNFPIGTTSVVYTARDAKNNSATCQFNIVVTRLDSCANDTIKPVFRNCPQNISATTTNTNTSVNVLWTAPTVTDNCGTPTITSNFPNGGSFPIGVTTVIYTARDTKGNTAECRFTISISTPNPCDNDIVPPVIANCPNNINLTTTSFNAIATWIPPTATDNCTTPSVTSNFPSGASFVLGSTVVVYTAKDAKGNTSECRFTVTVTQFNPCTNDREKPVFAGCPLTILQTTTNTSTTVRWTAPTASDNCSTPSVTSNFSSGATFYVGTTQVIYTARDAAGNTATCTFNVVVTRRTLQPGVCTQYKVENTNNVCSCPEKLWVPYGMFVKRGTGCGEFYKADQLSFQINGDSTARLKGVFRTQQWRPIYVDVFWTKTTQRQPRFEFCQTDSIAADNWQFFGAAQGIVRFDDEHPVNIFNKSQLQVGKGANGQNNDLLGASGLFETDNGLQGSFNFVLSEPQAAACPAACVADTTRPFFTNCPENVTQLGSAFPVKVDWKAPLVDDMCSSPNLATNYLPNSNFDAGTTAVVYTARDASGNSAECRFNVTLNRVPQGKLCTTYEVENTNNICGCAATQWKPYALHLESTTNCGDYFKSDSVRLTINGDNSVTLRGMFRSDEWQPIWVDMSFAKTSGGAPRLDLCQTPEVLTAGWQYFGAASGTIRLGNAPPVPVTSLPNAFLQLGLGANNQNLNQIGARASFTLGGLRANFSMVLSNKTQAICGEITACDYDSLPPVFTNCPANITVQTASTNANVSWTPPTVRDNCSTTPSVSSNFEPNARFPIGTSTVVYTARDTIGNVAQCRFNIVVTQNACANDTVAPTLSACPRDMAITTANPTVTLNWRLPTATDNCGTPTVTSSVPTDYPFPNGLTTVTVLARDAAGNTTQCRFNITITVLTTTNDPLSINAPIRVNYIAPNPATTFLVVDLESLNLNNTRFDVVNALGQVVYTQNHALNVGNNRLSLDVSRLAKGVYFLKIGESRTMSKFLKM
jgi:HYR domain/Secretion system C-terminal sorting domain